MTGIIEISDFEQELKDTLPEAYLLLKKAELKVHPNVQRITLHGSRGPAGGYRNDSDIDLCLITDIDTTKLPRDELGNLLRSIIQTTLENNHSAAELDLAAIFDGSDCGLSCFDVSDYEALQCEKEAKGCLGIYKIQKGFDGFVPPITQVSEMYPFLTIWKR